MFTLLAILVHVLVPVSRETFLFRLKQPLTFRVASYEWVHGSLRSSRARYHLLLNLTEPQTSCDAEGPFNDLEVNHPPVRNCS